MRTNHLNYDIVKSNERINEILSIGKGHYKKVDEIPKRSSLDYTNGYYVKVGALFIDIRGSSDLTEIHRKPALSKLYRCFVSECVAIMNADEFCREVYINGDCVWGVFNAKYKEDIQSMCYTSAKLNTLITLLNKNFEKNNIQEISVGIGMDCGDALMIQAGYKGSGLNDVVWMGDVVNNACHLADMAGKNGYSTIIMSSDVHFKLLDSTKSFFSKISGRDIYQGDVIMTEMNNWINDNV